MTAQELYTKFSQGVNWNAFLYLIYKITVTTMTFILYHRFDSGLFSTYSNLNAIIFLIILWLDFGFQKSIPRFCPQYAQHTDALTSFVRSILLFKLFILAAALPLYLVMAHAFAQTLHLQAYSWFFYAGSILLLSEGLVSVLRLIYHAYFLQKQFNSFNAFTLLVEVFLNIVLVITINNTHILLISLLASKTFASILLLLIASLQLPSLYKQVTKGNENQFNRQDLHKRFIIHSSIMWFNTNIKSLTERNFLVPLFTHVFGPVTANMFKVANDGALLFYRIVLKSIGTTDTALFSHVLTMGESKTTWQVAFKKLTTKIAALALPLLGIAVLLYKHRLWMKYDQDVFQIFLLITICFLLEVICSPYERILEVNRRYQLLFSAYIPYLLMVGLLLTTNIMTLIGLFNSICIIHGVRLVSALLMIGMTRIRYQLLFPVKFLLLLSMYIGIGLGIVEMLLSIIGSW